jgi:hypothetical protein
MIKINHTMTLILGHRIHRNSTNTATKEEELENGRHRYLEKIWAFRPRPHRKGSEMSDGEA